MPICCSSPIASCAWGFSSSWSRFSSLIPDFPFLVSVSVPVLSTTIASTWRSPSRAVASLMRMFLPAALPMPTISAVGVASPMAQGQAMTSTETADRIAWGSDSVPPMSSQTRNVTALTATTAGTKTRAILSTTRCTGAFEPCASCTMRIMLARTVFWPTASARKRRWVGASGVAGRVGGSRIVPASTLSPSFFSTATDSPVIIDSSMYAGMPLTTRPSTGIFSPGCTSMVSPGWRAEMGASTTMPLSTR